jgi:predicted dehydrogenase
VKQGKGGLKVGVIGAGAWGWNHVRTVASLADAELAAVCDPDAKVRERVNRQYPAAFVTGDVAALLAAVDAVVVASPAATHATIALQAIDAGKPVLVEKPFALSVTDAQQVARRGAERGVPVLAGHLLVYHPALERLREMVQTGELGQVFYLYGLRVNLGQVRKDENALWSFGPHDVSVALYLLDQQPTRVAAHGKSYLQPAIEDVVFLTMEFGSGVLAHVQMSWLDPHKERKLTVVGAKKMVVFDDMEPREKLRIYDKGVERSPQYVSFGENLAIREGDIFIPRIPTVEPLAAELAHFVRAARGQEAPRRGAGAEDGVRVVRVLEAASRSLAGGGSPEDL